MAAEKHELWRKYWSLLHDASDYIDCGYRRPHSAAAVPPPSAAPSPARRQGAGSGAAPAERQATAAAPPAAAATSPDELLAQIAEEIAGCTKCGLHSGRRYTVPGRGVIEPLAMFIGEAPGGEEDKSGIPFVGRAGQYLDKWLEAIGLSRDENVFIGNIIKCRPPNNRDPNPDEIRTCLPYLQRQIEIIRPKTILTLGRISSQVLSGRSSGIGALRGSTFRFMDIPCIPTYHPSGVLRNPEYRKPVWEDLQRLRDLFSNA